MKKVSVHRMSYGGVPSAKLEVNSLVLGQNYAVTLCWPDITGVARATIKGFFRQKE